MIVRSLAALLIVFAVGCASEKALNRGCASSVRVSAVVFDKAVYNAASQAELIEKFRSHDVEPLWSHILTPGGGDISSTRRVKVVERSRSHGSSYSSSSSSESSKDVGEWIKIRDGNDGMLGVECQFSFVQTAKSEQDSDIVHSGKVMGTVPVGAGDSVIGSVRADASGSQIIVIIISQ